MSNHLTMLSPLVNEEKTTDRYIRNYHSILTSEKRIIVLKNSEVGNAVK